MQLRDQTQPFIVEQQTLGEVSNYPPVVEAPVVVGKVYPNQQNMNGYQMPMQPQGVYPQYNQQYIPAYEQIPPPVIVQQQIPPELRTHPQLILIQNQMLLPCPSCGYLGSQVRRTAGCALYTWSVCLCLFTGLLLCWVPFCIDSCYDVEIVCSRCYMVKSYIEN